MDKNNISINNFLDKYQNKEDEDDFKYDVSVGHYFVEGDWSLNFKELHLDKYNIDEFKQLIEDYDNNRQHWEETESCKDCERRKKMKKFVKEMNNMNLKDLLNEMFDNCPEATQDYSLDIWDRYYLEFERKRLTDEQFENLKQVYFNKWHRVDTSSKFVFLVRLILTLFKINATIFLKK